MCCNQQIDANFITNLKYLHTGEFCKYQFFFVAYVAGNCVSNSSYKCYKKVNNDAVLKGLMFRMSDPRRLTAAA